MSASANQLSTSFALGVDTSAMEAKLEDAIPIEEGIWQYEPKWDGFRCLAFKAGDAVDIRAKSGKPLARYFPELVELLSGLEAPQFVVDGEIVIELSGVYSFDALQMRVHPAESRVRKLAAETPAKLVLFDMLADVRGHVLTD
jgi:ATP-dependent DNA ligase